MMKLEGKVLVAQGGGPTAVINQSLVGVILESRKFSQITRVYGSVHGVEGIVNEDFLDLSQETTCNLEQVATTASSALLSTRTKPDARYCKEIFKVLKAHEIRYFFYIGGNDSADTLRIVNQEAQKSDYQFRAVHIPKTIDNDLMCNDHTPGYASAARFVAQAFTGINLDVRSLPGVYIGVVMGRNVGFLTAAASMAKKYEDDGPHLIYLPERPFIMDQFIHDVNLVYQKYGRCIVAVSEGIRDLSGQPIVTRLVDQVERDCHGNLQLSGTGMLGDLLVKYVKQKLQIGRVRSDTFGYLQRSFVGCVSEIDRIEAREAGERGVQFALWHDVDGSVTLERTGSYSVDYRLTRLENVAAKTRSMPEEFIHPQSNQITPRFKEYLRPLLGEELEDASRLRAPKVPKLLNREANQPFDFQEEVG